MARNALDQNQREYLRFAKSLCRYFISALQKSSWQSLKRKSQHPRTQLKQSYNKLYNLAINEKQLQKRCK